MNNKMRILPPTLREKKRYVSFQVISEEPVVYSDLESAIWNIMLDFLGEYGVSKTSVWLMKERWKEKGQSGVIRCNNLYVQDVLASLGMVDRLGDNRIVFKIGKISGTLKGLS